jgi:hypothetical protein
MLFQRVETVAMAIQAAVELSEVEELFTFILALQSPYPLPASSII